MAKAKGSEPRDFKHRWRVSLKTPAQYLGHLYAEDETTAIKKAAAEFKVPDTQRDRIVVAIDVWTP